MLTCERPLLNLLGRLSGIATLTRQYVRRVEGTRARIYDTRKTTPGWRRLEKYAVRCGGGHESSHRLIRRHPHQRQSSRAGSANRTSRPPTPFAALAISWIACPPSRYRASMPADMIVEVEIDRLEAFDDVLAAGPDIVLLDNMPPEQLRAAVARRDDLAPHIELEASGGVSLETVRDIALTGVERISVGGLTHSARSLDVALDWVPSQRACRVESLGWPVSDGQHRPVRGCCFWTTVDRKP